MKDKPVSERDSGRALLYEMAGFAEGGTCRRKMMLHYFGETYDEKGCNQLCDNCRFPKEKYDATKDVSLALNVVDRVNQKFGVNHLVDILRGSQNQAVQLYEHNELSLHGKGSSYSDKEWKNIFTQIIVQDYLRKDIEEYGTLKLTRKGKKFLDMPSKTELFKYRDLEAMNRDAPALESFKTYDEELFGALKILRRKLAKEKGIPPYVIFQDPSLEDMATKYPLTMAEFQNITGVGQGKAKKFAAPFLKMITEYVEAKGIERTTEVVVKSAARKSMNKLFIIQHVDRRTPLDQIADIKKLEYSELLDNIEQIVFSGTKLDLDYYIENQIDEEVIDEIYDYFMGSDVDDLTVAEEEFGGEYSLEDIRLVRLKFMSEVGN